MLVPAPAPSIKHSLNIFFIYKALIEQRGTWKGIAQGMGGACMVKWGKGHGKRESAIIHMDWISIGIFRRDE